jgi:decaprenylphospho-beta-D-erythro-pentofuranosid-2-ulose 2-reductase
VKIAILGATSAIAHETAKCFAAEGARFFLVARNGEKLEAVAADLRVRGAAEVITAIADLGDFSRHGMLSAAAGRDVDVVLIAHGVYPEQRDMDRDPDAQRAAFELNANSVISLAASFANVLEDNRRGTLAVIGSVAGDRGRRTNYVYGAAKAAVHAYCEGLRGRLREANVNVLTIKPGWVDTPMTARIRKNKFYATASSVGRGIHDAIQARAEVVYLPKFWRWIAVILRIIPSRLVRF